MTNHILFIADGRSPTAKSWIKNTQALGYAVSLISTYACEAPQDLMHFHILPIAFSQFSSGIHSAEQKPSKNLLNSIKRRFSSVLQGIRYILGPLTVLLNARRYRQLVEEIQPDLVHALRIPFEGMLASYTPGGFPCIAATWGNDLTLHARGSLFMRSCTRRCMRRVQGLSSDTMRDVRLAKTWGLDPDTPTLIVPGSGGLDMNAIQNAGVSHLRSINLPKNVPWVVNPRGLRPGSVHQDVFFAAIPKVLQESPDCVFLCPNLEGVQIAKDWINKHRVGENSHLLPKLPQTQLWSLYKQAEVFVSPSSHDGTPNTLLEAMACGCFPVVGDIESLREWINHGVNGFLVDPLDPNDLAQAILSALDQQELRKNAADLNLQMILARAAQTATLPKIKAFYDQFLN